MTNVQSQAPKLAAEPDRRSLILSAAERAFVRHGFHAATMHHVADEAHMSAGNLYRYFPSKEAIVESLCCQDQKERARNFAALADSENVLTAIEAGIREHLLVKPRQKLMMILEIWAEAGRNPRIAEMTRTIDLDVRQGLTMLVEAAKARGEAHASVDAAFAARVIYTLVGGLFKRRALEPDFDIETEAKMVLGVFAALFAGLIGPFSPDSSTGPK
jgi:TetR/AcrR family transcriptional repressor of uid operon